MSNFKKRHSSAFADTHSAMMSDAKAPFLSKGRFNHSFEVPVSKVLPDPEQPRKFFDDAALLELSESFEKTGQLQPILVRENPANPDEWLIVAGERRWRAASLLEWDTMLAVSFDGDAQLASLLENLIRVDLSAAEEAQAIRKIIDNQNWTQKQAAEELGLDQGNISRAMKAATLPGDFLAHAAQKSVPMYLLALLGREANTARRTALMSKALEGTLKASDFKEKPKPQPKAPTARKIESFVKRAETFTRDLDKLAPSKDSITEENRAKIQTLISRLSAVIG